MRYASTHPWLTFRFTPQVDFLWAKLGEAFSTNQHLAGTPLPPSLALELSQIVLNKGALATTAIEGNSLTEQEATDILSGRKKLPKAQQYLEVEIQNILDALNLIGESRRAGESFRLSAEWIQEQNT